MYFKRRSDIFTLNDEKKSRKFPFNFFSLADHAYAHSSNNCEMISFGMLEIYYDHIRKIKPPRFILENKKCNKEPSDFKRFCLSLKKRLEYFLKRTIQN